MRVSKNAVTDIAKL